MDMDYEDDLAMSVQKKLTLSEDQLIRVDFSDIRPGYTVTMTAEAPGIICVFEVIMAICERDRKYASQIFQRLLRNRSANCRSFMHVTIVSLEGQCKTGTPFMSIHDMLKLIPYLPGAAARNYVSAVTAVFQKYMPSNESLQDNQPMRGDGGAGGSMDMDYEDDLAMLVQKKLTLSEDQLIKVDFGDIRPGYTVTMTAEAPRIISVFEVIMAVCQQDRDYASKIF
jgi:hypothetical protein